jgi:hypothetical protein
MGIEMRKKRTQKTKNESIWTQRQNEAHTTAIAVLSLQPHTALHVLLFATQYHIIKITLKVLDQLSWEWRVSESAAWTQDLFPLNATLQLELLFLLYISPQLMSAIAT